MGRSFFGCPLALLLLGLELRDRLCMWCVRLAVPLLGRCGVEPHEPHTPELPIVGTADVWVPLWMACCWGWGALLEGRGATGDTLRHAVSVRDAVRASVCCVVMWAWANAICRRVICC